MKILVIINILLVLMWMISCNHPSLQTIKRGTDTSLPIIHGENISSLIEEDSDVYRLSTKVWDIYASTDSPYWYFPKGIYLEKLDTLFHLKGYVKADTAYFFEKIEKWKLIGHVRIQNLEGIVFKTSKLIYNQGIPQNSIEAVSTDQNIQIHLRNELITTAQGIKANAAMTEYILYNNSFETILNE